jgi:hypothetical protein
MIACLNCNTNKQTNKNEQSQSAANSITKEDSKIIEQLESEIFKSDSSLSETKCAETISFYDNNDFLVLRKSIQHCMSDTRMTWRTDVYYDKNMVVVLKIYYDGLGKIKEVTR